jgi:hypothetical protein
VGALTGAEKAAVLAPVERRASAREAAPAGRTSTRRLTGMGPRVTVALEQNAPHGCAFDLQAEPEQHGRSIS